MSEIPKQNEELAKSVAGFLDKYGAKLYESVRKISKDAYDESRINWRFGYERYLEKSLNKYYYAKTFLSYNQPLPLYDLYVPLSVASDHKEIRNTSITDLMEENNFSIIMATGGSGKTMMLRHLFVDTIEQTSQVPVFVELRELNDSKLDLYGLITKKLRDNQFDFDDEYIKKAFEAGHFVLLLDGFDEVAEGKRDDIVRQISEIAEKFEKNYIVLSSRYDISLSYWLFFTVWEVVELSLELACELVEKAENNIEIKKKFIRDLKKNLFKDHRSFLSNPLLLSIMLITYKSSADIPQRITTFYENAYFALFQQHDASKALNRKKHSKLDYLEFKKVFSAFCFLTHHKSLYNFSEAQVLEYLEKVKTYIGIDFSKTLFLHDCIQSVCLLVRDGLDITFTHRSFQEYFAAVFLSNWNDNQVQVNQTNSLLKNFVTKGNTIELLLEIAPEKVEKYLLIPGIEEIEKEIGYKEDLTINTYKKLLTFLYSGLRFESTGGLTNPDRNWALKAIYVKEEVAQRLFDVINEKFLNLINIRLVSSRFNDLMSDYHHNRVVNLENAVPINGILKKEKLLNLLIYGEHFLSLDHFQKIFNVKEQLVEKHKKQEMFLEEELFE